MNFVSLYRILTILALNIIFIFEFAFKFPPVLFFLLFIFIDTHIFNLVHIFLIKFKFSISMYFLFITNFFLQEEFIHIMVNNRIVILPPVKLPSVCRIVPVILSRPIFIILRTKFSQDIVLILLMTGAVYETLGFGYLLLIMYICFTAVEIALTHLRVSF